MIELEGSALIVADFSISGGTREYFRYLISSLSGGKIYVAIPARAVNKDLEQFLNYKDVHVCKLRTFDIFFKIFFLRFIWEFFVISILKFKYRPNLIICSTGNIKNWLYIFLQSTNHVHVLHSSPNSYGIYFKLYFTVIKLFSNSKKHVVIVVSNYAAKRLARHLPFRILVVHNFSRILSPILNHDKPHNDMSVVSLGHVREYKNPYVWVDVARQVVKEMDNVSFYWYGEGELLYQMQCVTFGDNKIHFMDEVCDISSVLGQATVFFHPTKLENHSLSILEAMSFKIPCVVSHVGGNPESVVDGLTGFVYSPNDVQGFVSSILLLLNDNMLRDRMGLAGYDLVSSKFSLEIWENKFQKILDSL
ncbi:MAG: glycosyltransferase [Desulfomicrobium sp.]